MSQQARSEAETRASDAETRTGEMERRVATLEGQLKRLNDQPGGQRPVLDTSSVERTVGQLTRDDPLTETVDTGRVDELKKQADELYNPTEQTMEKEKQNPLLRDQRANAFMRIQNELLGYGVDLPY